ncbi:MAG: DUF3782 domain-containing protein [Deltaproteobacteria bacterium]|nr:MAG: DUF3782 domain-containing protein [Deltaproteobacteria bacterium]
MDMQNATTFGEIKDAFQEIWRLYKETDKKFQETDRQFKETDRRFKETDKKIQETSRQIGKLGNRLGQFVEEMVRPSAVALFRERGIDVHATARNMAWSDGTSGIEIDLVVQNGSEVVLIECKSELSVEDVNEHLKRMEKFKKYFPAYKDNKVMGAVAAMVIPEGVDRYAYQKGLFVLAQNGDFMKILNDKQFNAKIY